MPYLLKEQEGDQCVYSRVSRAREREDKIKEVRGPDNIDGDYWGHCRICLPPKHQVCANSGLSTFICTACFHSLNHLAQ